MRSKHFGRILLLTSDFQAAMIKSQTNTDGLVVYKNKLLALSQKKEV